MDGFDHNPATHFAAKELHPTGTPNQTYPYSSVPVPVGIQYFTTQTGTERVDKNNGDGRRREEVPLLPVRHGGAAGDPQAPLPAPGAGDPKELTLRRRRCILEFQLKTERRFYFHVKRGRSALMYVTPSPTSWALSGCTASFSGLVRSTVVRQPVWNGMERCLSSSVLRSCKTFLKAHLFGTRLSIR